MSGDKLVKEIARRFFLLIILLALSAVISSIFAALVINFVDDGPMIGGDIIIYISDLTIILFTLLFGIGSIKLVTMR
ncbi:MAG: hypothetical protein OXF23_06545 [Candidatus Dadabacteria bacterium]|nr:hypothetical protein [Candidatus Dadabacteria bacterium]